jgi:hypothetical protein
VDEVGAITKQEVMARIQKENQNYSKTVSFEYLGSYKNGNDFLTETLEAIPVPVGISVGKPTYSPFDATSQPWIADFNFSGYRVLTIKNSSSRICIFGFVSLDGAVGVS